MKCWLNNSNIHTTYLKVLLRRLFELESNFNKKYFTRRKVSIDQVFASFHALFKNAD